MTTEIALIEPAAIVAAFGEPSRMDEILDRIEAETRSEVADVATKKGRDAIASLAFKVAKSKTALDAAGKKLNETARAHINAVDAERRRAWDRLEKLQAEIRQPLTDWEAAESARVDAIKARINRIIAAHDEMPEDATAEQISSVLSRVESVAIDESWAEFTAEGARAKDLAAMGLRRRLATAIEREAQAAELARLRAEAEARAEADRIREEQDRAERERLAAERVAAELQAEHERQKQEAVANADKEAEARAQAAAELAAKEAADRESKLRAEIEAEKQRAEQIAQAERDRIAAEAKAEADALAQRKADTAHRARVQTAIAEALEAYMAMGAMGVADAIIGGAIPHIRVTM